MLRKITSSLLLLSMAVCIIFSVPSVGAYAAADGTGYYIITSSNGVNMRSGPGTSYSRVTGVPANTVINVTQISGIWGKTTYSGSTGWISLDYAKKTTAPSYSTSHQKILDGLDSLRKKFPDGKYWNHYGSPNVNPDGWTNTPCPDGHKLDGVQQCNGQCDGFARKLGLDLFGLSTYSWEKKTSTLEGLCVGDIIRYRDRHTIMVTGFTEDNNSLIIADCNWDYHCGISWDRYFSISRYITDSNFYVLHYPGNTLTKEAFFNELVPKITFKYSTFTVSAGNSFELEYTCENVFDEPTWTSSNTSVATVNSYGEVTGISAGTAVITASYDGKTSASCTVTVTPHMDIERFYGNNRIETACDIALGGWENSQTVIIANAYSFADSLAGVPLSKALDAPILLTGNSPSGIEDDITFVLEYLEAKNICILGGNSSVSTSIENALKKDYSVTRISGSTRFETAAAIAKELGSLGVESDKAFAVTAYSYPDALSVSSVAAIIGAPILYVGKGGSVDAATTAYLKSAHISNVNIVGGQSSIPDAIVQNLKNCGVTNVERTSGASRFLTCLEINKKYASVFSTKAISIATGYSYPDALAGGALAAKLEIPVMLADLGTKMCNGTTEFLRAFKPAAILVFGGQNSVTDQMIYKYTNF